MATAKWSAPSAPSTLTLPTTSGEYNSLANGGTSTFISYDNSTNRALYASIRVTLGSLAAATGASITLNVFAAQDGTAPDNTGSLNGGDYYTKPLTVGTGVKEVNFPMVRLYPESMRFTVTNSSGVTFAASGNAMYLRTFNEDVT